MTAQPLKGLRVHVEGLGVTGSLLAYHLERWGCKWTWHDANAERTAWKASTGAIYPAGAPGSLDWECYAVWAEWLGAGRLKELPYPAKHFEPATYWYSTKSPPHGGRYKVLWQDKRSGLSLAEPLSYHLNAQTFVPATRRQFKGRVLLGPPHNGDVDAYIVAHGFGQRLHHVVWGWTVPVQLRLPVRMADGYRPAFYFREGRFVMAYAYPMPGTEFWYAGSSLIRQAVPRELEVPPKLHRWRKTFERLSGGSLKVTEARLDAALQGWRPAERDPHCLPVVDHQRPGKTTLRVPPLWHSGIRHFPRVLQQLRAKLEAVR